MTKTKNQNMTTFFIWLGVIAGLLTIISLAGYRIYSGKVRGEDEKKATGQRTEIKDEISNTKSELSEKMKDESTIILEKIELSKEEIIEKTKPIISPPPIVEFEFVHPNNLAYKIKNNSKETIAENVLVSFGIFDLDKIPFEPTPIPSTEISYINPGKARGPWKVIGNFTVPNHRYFGIMYLNCKGCRELKTYWVYIEINDKGNSFYAERNENDTYEIQVGKLANNDIEYFDALIPESRRMYVK